MAQMSSNRPWNNTAVGQAQFAPYWGVPQLPQTSTYTRAPVYHAEPIHGENAAWAFPIGGGDIWLPDADNDLIWWIKIDQNGNKQVLPFDINPHEEPKAPDINDILSRLDALEERMNGKQNKSNAKRNGGGTTTAAATTASVQSDD